ncbi:MAG TPA: hypothetical protein VK826_11665 [Bacteroidia bacterium]|nr:hypothetical protein [Bacteroidia bacterium]
MKRIALSVALIFAASTIYVGCKKDDVADTETTSATDNSLCEGEFMRVLPTVNKIAIDEPGVHRVPFNSNVTVTCPNISVSTPNQFPLTMTLDYGTGCTDPVDGKVRSGRMLVEFDRSWDSVGCVMTVTLDSFHVGAIHFEGTCSITRTSANQFRQIILDGHCSKAGSTPWDILWNTDKTVTWTSGSQNSSDNQVIEITGTNSGTDRNGKTFTATVTTPIVRDMSCTWITKGTVVLTPQGLTERTIDFGTGTCDNRGTITIEGNTFEFSMQ